jgi:hypothetical protein
VLTKIGMCREVLVNSLISNYFSAVLLVYLRTNGRGKANVTGAVSQLLILNSLKNELISKKTQRISIAEVNLLMLFGNIIVVYSESHIKPYIYI